MYKIHIPFIAFAVLVILITPTTSDVVAPVVASWNRTILPSFFVITFIVFIFLLIATFAYRILPQKTKHINWKIFITHLLLSLPVVILSKFPFLLFNQQSSAIGELKKPMNWEVNTIYLACVLFISGQIIFGIYFIKTASR